MLKFVKNVHTVRLNHKELKTTHFVGFLNPTIRKPDIFSTVFNGQTFEIRTNQKPTFKMSGFEGSYFGSTVYLYLLTPL